MELLTKNMKITETKISNKPFIIIDDFYSSKADQEALYLAAQSLPYKIQGKPSEDVQNRHNLRLTSDVNDQFFAAVNLFSDDRFEVFDKYAPIDDYTIYRSYCNLGLVSDYQEPHVDHYAEGASMSLILYCNKDWQTNWGGETYFYSDDMKKVEYVSQIEAGKALLFDGSIPHMAKVQHNFSDSYRFTLAIKFVRKDFLPKNNHNYEKV